MEGISLKKILVGIALVVVVIVLLSMSGSVLENNPADKILVIQDPVDGELHYHVTPGIKFQKFGKITYYNKSSQYWFSEQADQGGNVDQSIKVRFNDGGHATMSGSFRWNMPLDPAKLQLLHTKYGSQAAIEQDLVRTVAEKAVYMTGPLMSSKESYAERRPDLVNLTEDQINNGIFKTRSEEIKGIDPMTGKEKTFTIVKIVEDTNEPNSRARQEESPLQEFGIKASNLSINSVKYDGTVEAQINQQQQAIMEVQTAMANAKKAEQGAITAEKDGQANAARAKWEQEVIKAKLVTEAEQQRDVARLNRDAAKFTKEEQILLGEGEAARKRLVMQADGALEKKLATYENVMKTWADAISKYNGAWVPTVVMGSTDGSAQSGSGATDLINLLTAATANNLGLDMTIPRGKTASK